MKTYKNIVTNIDVSAKQAYLLKSFAESETVGWQAHSRAQGVCVHIYLPFAFWSWQLAAILVVLSIVGLFVGSLPDNDRKPVGDAFRYPMWVITALYFVSAALHGIGLF